MKYSTIIYRHICLLVLLCMALCAYGEKQLVYLPDPIMYLSFDNPGNLGYDVKNSKTGTFLGTLQSASDRFGKPNRAIRFQGAGSAVRFENVAVNSENTISFWTYISDPSTIPTGATPFSNTDRVTNFYNWTDANNNILRGVARKKATIGFNRYISKDDGSRVPWYLWSYEPAQFDQQGWYHIYVVQANYFTRLIMYKPDGKKAYSYNWLGAQSFSDRKYIYIGGLPGQYGSETSFDEFKLFNVALSDDQIDCLHAEEYPINYYVRIVNKNSHKFIVIQNASLDDDAQLIQHDSYTNNCLWRLYPTGVLNEFRIFSLHSHKRMVVQSASTETNANIIQHTTGEDNGIWILEPVVNGEYSYRLKNKNSGLYLATINGSGNNDINIVQKASSDANNVWYFELDTPVMNNLPIDNGLYRLKNKNSGKYLDINVEANGNSNIIQNSGSPIKYSNIWNITKSTNNGFFIQNIVDDKYLVAPNSLNSLEQIREGNNTDNNRDIWQFLPTSIEGEYELYNVHNEKYAVVRDASTNEGADVVQYPTGESSNAIWKLEKYFYSDSPLHHGWYSFTNLYTNKLMVVYNASLSNGANLVQHSTGEDNSIFEVFETKWGTVSLENVNSNKFVVVRDASVNENAAIIQYENTPGPNGNWVVSRSYFSGAHGYEFRNLRSGLVLTVANLSMEDNAPLVQKEIETRAGTWMATAKPQPRFIQTASLESVSGLESEVVFDVAYFNDQITVYSKSEPNSTVSVRIVNLVGQQVYQANGKLLCGSAIFTGFKDSVKLNNFYIFEIVLSNGEKRIVKKLMIR